jgi:hypothetical protein
MPRTQVTFTPFIVTDAATSSPHSSTTRNADEAVLNDQPHQHTSAPEQRDEDEHEQHRATTC